jgi:hypothetical protein
MPDQVPAYEISIKLNSLDQLFHSLDPSPFREKDLDERAEEYILKAAQHGPPNAPLSIFVRVPRKIASSKAAQETPDAVRNFFRYRSEHADHELRELFREGRRALLVGVPVFTVCLLLSQYIKLHLGEQTIGRLLGESLLIFGWVANWRPIEIFLYAWWPIQRRKRLYIRLASAQVTVCAE